LAFCDNIPEAVPVCRQTLTGPFKKWRHLHMFSNIDKHDQKQTEIIDEVEFEIPYSRIRKLFEGHALDSRNYSIIEKKLPLEL